MRRRIYTGPVNKTCVGIATGIAAFMATVLVGWWLVAGSVTAQGIERRLVAAGFGADVRVELDGLFSLHVTGVEAKRTLPFAPWNARITVREIVAPLSPLSLLSGSMPLESPVLVSGVRVTVDVAPSAHEEAPTSAEPGPGDAVSWPGRLLGWCAGSCEAILADVEVDLRLPGLDAGPLDRLTGRLVVDEDATLVLRVERPSGTSGTLKLAYGRDGLDLAMEVVNTGPLTLGRTALSLATQGEAPRHVSEVSGSVERVALLGRALRLEGFEGKIVAADNRVIDLSFDRLDVADVAAVVGQKPHGGIVLQGVRTWLRTVEGDPPQHVSLGIVRMGGPGMHGCRGLPLCPDLIEDVQVVLDRPGGRDLQAHLGLGTLTGCGPRCIQVEDASVRAFAASDHVTAEWRRVTSRWLPGRYAPYDLTLNGGLVHVARERAEDKDGDTQRWDSDAEARLTQEARKRRRRKQKPEHPDFVRQLRNQLGVADHHVDAALDVVSSGLRAWIDGSGSRMPALRVEHTDVTLSGVADSDLGVTVKHMAVGPGDGDRTTWAGAVDVPIPDSHRLWKDELPQTALATSGRVAASGGSLGLRFRASIGNQSEVTVDFSGWTPMLHLSHPKLAAERVDVEPMTFQGALSRRRGEGGTVWELEQLDVHAMQGAAGHLSALLRLEHSNKGGQLVADLSLPPQDCDRLHRSIPSQMLPHLADARFIGDGAMSVHLSLPFHMTEALDVDVKADFSTCEAAHLGSTYDVNRLNERYAVFRVHDPKLPDPVAVGPGTGNWVSMESMPSHIWGAAMATEDFGFFGHEGFSGTFISRALRLNLRTRRYAYGGSTITQQLVKNLFLTRQKTLARKLEEAVLVWQVERHVSKRRILSLYLNCIEYGPNIYGIKRASRRYFGVQPWRLRPVESAFLMNIKPFPGAGYFTFKKRKVSAFFRERVVVIRDRLLRRGMITPEQADEMSAETLYDRFKGPT